MEQMEEGGHKRLPSTPKSGTGGTDEEGKEESI